MSIRIPDIEDTILFFDNVYEYNKCVSIFNDNGFTEYTPCYNNLLKSLYSSSFDSRTKRIYICADCRTCQYTDCINLRKRYKITYKDFNKLLRQQKLERLCSD